MTANAPSGSLVRCSVAVIIGGMKATAAAAAIPAQGPAISAASANAAPTVRAPTTACARRAAWVSIPPGEAAWPVSASASANSAGAPGAQCSGWAVVGPP